MEDKLDLLTTSIEQKWENVNFTVEKSEKYYLNQVKRVNTISDII